MTIIDIKANLTPEEHCRMLLSYLDYAAEKINALRFHPDLPRDQHGTLDRIAVALRDAREAAYVLIPRT